LPSASPTKISLLPDCEPFAFLVSDLITSFFAGGSTSFAGLPSGDCIDVDALVVIGRDLDQADRRHLRARLRRHHHLVERDGGRVGAVGVEQGGKRLFVLRLVSLAIRVDERLLLRGRGRTGRKSDASESECNPKTHGAILRIRNGGLHEDEARLRDRRSGSRRAWHDPGERPIRSASRRRRDVRPAIQPQPAVLRALILAKTETTPFQPVAPVPAMSEAPKLYPNLGTLRFKAGTQSGRAQQWFDQGVRLSFAFNHAEAQRAFREAQKIDPACALCYWGEALVLGPNVNVPMMPEGERARAGGARKGDGAREVGPLARSRVDRGALDALLRGSSRRRDRSSMRPTRRDGRGRKDLSGRHGPHAVRRAMMDAQPWDYWEGGGEKPKGNGAAIVETLENGARARSSHPGAIHLYIHAVEASTRPERALPYASRLAAQMPGAGHIVHMPAHIYYRVGLYRESLDANRKAIGVDERYFRTSPSDPLYKAAYYPHNIHFLMVSAQMGGEARTALERGRQARRRRCRRARAPVRDHAARQGRALHDARAGSRIPRRFSPCPPALRPRRRRRDVPLRTRDGIRAQGRSRLGERRDRRTRADRAECSLEAVRRVGRSREGDRADRAAGGDGPARRRQGRPCAAAKAYEDAVFIEDTLAYMEPPYWYYPVRQSLGGVLLRQGKLDGAEKAFRESLARVRNNGWALAGLAATYKRKGDAAAEKAAHRAFSKSWFGPPGGPISRRYEKGIDRRRLSRVTAGCRVRRRWRRRRRQQRRSAARRGHGPRVVELRTRRAARRAKRHRDAEPRTHRMADARRSRAAVSCEQRPAHSTTARP
jgi:tetratricopeptide (TPR) repeat protein